MISAQRYERLVMAAKSDHSSLGPLHTYVMSVDERVGRRGHGTYLESPEEVTVYTVERRKAEMRSQGFDRAFEGLRVVG